MAHRSDLTPRERARTRRLGPPPTGSVVRGGRRRRRHLGAVGESPEQEAGHLSLVTGSAGQNRSFSGGCTGGDADSGDELDALLVGGAVVVNELIATTVFGIAKSPDQERRHLLAGHRIIGAKSTRIGLVATFGHTCSDEQVDVVSWVVPSSSQKRSPAPGWSYPMALTRNEAICARITG